MKFVIYDREQRYILNVGDSILTHYRDNFRSMAKHTQLATIGYQGAALPDFIATLVEAGIKRVVDVREIAQSRRRGFSKNAFREALNQAGIEYHHIRQLGDPKHGREAARAGQFDLFQRIFSAHLELPASLQALKDAVELAEEKKSVLVCFERDPKHCHRTIVAERISALSSLSIMNLGVAPGRSRGEQGDATPTNRFVGTC